jgi:tetratricopeptide (TPR) repeat protein
MSMGDLDSAIVRLERARALAETPVCDDTDRSEVLYQLGCCRLKSGEVANAVRLLTVALRLCEESPTLSDRLRIDILCWRTRCYRRQRDWDSARADADAAIQLAEELNDAARLADAYFQSSQIAERTGQLLMARFYIERSIELQRDAGDPLAAGKALNNLGGILFLLGEKDAAKTRLNEAFAIALEYGNHVDAAYAVSSTAQVLLRAGESESAEQKARYALELLDDRQDHVSEIGNARLVLGRALMEQGRFDEATDELAGAAESFEQMDSLGHRAAAWLAQGDLASRRGRIEDAAAVYRRAAESLQDVRF